MANKNLENLVNIRQLKAEPASTEISGLLRSGIARLADSKNKDLNIESRFDLAYNAAHAFSLAELRAAGYRSTNRYLGEYEGEVEIDFELLESLIRVADTIAGNRERLMNRIWGANR